MEIESSFFCVWLNLSTVGYLHLAGLACFRKGGLLEVNWCLKLKSLVLTGKPMHKERRSAHPLCRVSSRHRRMMPIRFLTNCCVPFAMIWWRTPLSYPAVETATVMNVSLWTHLVILLICVTVTCPAQSLLWDQALSYVQPAVQSQKEYAAN